MICYFCYLLLCYFLLLKSLSLYRVFFHFLCLNVFVYLLINETIYGTSILFLSFSLISSRWRRVLSFRTDSHTQKKSSPGDTLPRPRKQLGYSPLGRRNTTRKIHPGVFTSSWNIPLSSSCLNRFLCRCVYHPVWLVSE